MGSKCIQFGVIAITSHTGHLKFNMVPHGKEPSEDLKENIVALHKDGIGHKKIAKTLKMSCSMVGKTIHLHLVI